MRFYRKPLKFCLSKKNCFFIAMITTLSQYSFYYTSLYIISSSFAIDLLCGELHRVQMRKYLRVLNALASSSPAGFAKNLPTSCGRSVFLAKNLQRLNTTFSLHPKLDHTPHRLRYGRKKKSEIMKSIVKNRKQRPTAYLPINIKLVVKVAVVVLGFSIWGTGFVWALVGLYLFFPILRAILSILVGFAAIIIFLFILLSFL